MKTAMPTRVKPLQMLDPLEPNYRRPGLREIAELQGAMTGLPTGGDIDRSIAERRDRLLEALERTTLEGSKRTVLEKLWADAMTATGQKSDFVARTAVAFLSVAFRAYIERERDRHFSALTDTQRRDATMRSLLQARSDEITSETLLALSTSDSRPAWICSYDSFMRHLVDQFAGLETT